MLVVFTVGLVGCAARSQSGEELAAQTRCPALPGNFTMSHLIGSWEARYGAATDHLVIREDGSYDQSYVRDTDGYSFRNESRSWSYVLDPAGQAYLHLEGMRRCDNTDELCENPNGGGGDFHYWDFCLDRFVAMPDEVVLMITGFPEGIPSDSVGIVLWHMAPSADAGSFRFVKVDE